MDKITQKFEHLKNEAPAGWAERIAEETGKSVESVYAYARGDRGKRDSIRLEVLRILIMIVEEHKLEIKKLTA